MSDPIRGSSRAQGGDREDVGAGVDLADEAFVVGGVLLLDDAIDAAVGVAHDAAVAGRVVEHGGEHGRGGVGGAVLGDELAEGRGVEQGDVAADDHDLALEALGQSRDRELDGASRAGDLVLVDDDHLGHELDDHGRDGIPFVPDDGDDVRRRELASGREHMSDDGHARRADEGPWDARTASAYLARRRER